MLLLVSIYVNMCAMKKYIIKYYSEQVEQEILSLPLTLAARYVHLTRLMLTYGSNLGEPHTKSLGDGLFEMRLKGMEGIARVFIVQ